MGDLISDSMSSIMSAELHQKKEVVLTKCSSLLLGIVKIMKDNGYIGSYEFTPNERSGVITIKLINKINKIGSIRPRYPCTADKVESFEKVYLPAAGFGIIIISTPNGLMTHYEAKKQGLGGVLVSYCY